MIVAGIGCRKGTSASEIDAVIEAALAGAGLRRGTLVLIATSARKYGEAGIAMAAANRGLPLALVTQIDLEAAGARVASHSQRVFALSGVSSVAEAAALAAGGPQSRLIAPRVVLGPATCALAEMDPAP